MDQKQPIADRLKQANNILVTVSSNPSVDQLASCIGLTLALNKLGKHATAVFSGSVPSTIEFLQPEKTIETNTDSLRDFIISLDKTKADKLRYKVEDKVVKIFITPYRTSITEKDLDFSQGDFNVEVVIALGVHNQSELDQAITSHGRILHDATIATLNVKPGGELGSINWLDPGASSLSELCVQLLNGFDNTLIDAQMATAFLTGIVAETGRFSNEKTSPMTMSISAELMGAGANQQLVVSKLGEVPAPLPEAETGFAEATTEEIATDDQPVDLPEEGSGTLEISHLDRLEIKPDEVEKQEQASGPLEPPAMPQIDIDAQGGLHKMDEASIKEAEATTNPAQHVSGSRMILQPPSLGGTMSASGLPDGGYTSSDPLSAQPNSSFAGSSGFGRAPFTPPTSVAVPPSAPYATTGVVTGIPSAQPPSQLFPSPAFASTASFGQAPPAYSAYPPSSAFQPAAPNNPAIASAYSPETPAAAPGPPTVHLDNARDAVMQAIASQPPNAVHPAGAPAFSPTQFGSALDNSFAPPTGSPVIPTTPPQANTGPPPPGPPPMMPPTTS